MKDIDPKKLKRDGITAELFNEEYYLSEVGGKKILEKAIKSGDFSNVFHSHIYQKALEIAQPSREQRILDIGCGRGEITLMLAWRGIPVTGIDYSSNSIALCNDLRKLLPQEQQGLVAFKQVNISDQHLGLEDERFNLIFFLDVIEHLTSDQAQKVLKNIYRLIRPGGRLILHTNNLYFEKVAYRAVAFFYHGWRGFTKFGTQSIREAQTPYEHLHIHYYSLPMLHKALRGAGFEAKVWYTRPETLAQVQRLISLGNSLIRKPVPHLV